MNEKHAEATPDRSTFHPGGRVGFLLIHGLGGTPVELRYVAQGIARAGYTVYCCQLAGHCASVETLRNSTPEQWYASVEAAHDRLSAHCDVIIAGGLSMGGILAAQLAQSRPDGVQGLAFYAPTLWLNGWSMPWHSRVLRYLRPTRFNIKLTLPEHEPYGLKDERVRALVVRSMQSKDSSEAGVFCTPVRCFSHFNALCDVVKPRLPEIKAPALIMHPRDDDIAAIDNAFYLQRHLGGRVEMVVMEDSYHIITLDKQRQVVVDRSIGFAESIARSNASRIAVPAPALRKVTAAE
ncbi:MAG: alpha/beta fold hydrolase [Hyphomicrobiaceae bacterium]|nr:alpha/beta fold hydrolase [Hyphomicrobiaceae bacterium]